MKLFCKSKIIRNICFVDNSIYNSFVKFNNPDVINVTSRQIKPHQGAIDKDKDYAEFSSKHLFLCDVIDYLSIFPYPSIAHCGLVLFVVTSHL